MTFRRFFSWSVLFFAMAVFSAGCGKNAADNAKKEATTPAAPAAPAAQAMQAKAGQETFNFREILARAREEERFFSGLCRLLLTRSVLFALDTQETKPEVDDKGNPTKFSIKVLKPAEDKGPGAALIFSSKESLAAAGDKFSWAKNEKGMYSFASVNGQAAFRILKDNGYSQVILDSASPTPLMLNPAEIQSLADGKIPPFHKAS